MGSVLVCCTNAGSLGWQCGLEARRGGSTHRSRMSSNAAVLSTPSGRRPRARHTSTWIDNVWRLRKCTASACLMDSRSNGVHMGAVQLRPHGIPFLPTCPWHNSALHAICAMTFVDRQDFDYNHYTATQHRSDIVHTHRTAHYRISVISA